MRTRLLLFVLAFLCVAAARAQDATPDKGKLSYALGYDYGRSLVENRIDVDQATLLRAIQDGMARKTPAEPPQQIAVVLQALKQKLYAQAKAAFDKASAENKVSSDSLLAKNRVRPGVKVLPSGVQYRVIEEGNGPSPRPDGQARILYRAAISTGQEFASSYNVANPQPTTIVINESPLAGIKQILPMMRQGSHWEVVLPPDQAYGSSPGSPVGPNQALLMDIKMIEVLK
ncbi:MAG TPA: FKBP-type peptidyl-prolyl cis-trans isomerase N-terminal domain-containing protein [Xanthomonadaceae bacterium]|jgi:FKBP-type peptidyl-prolyl cis-trans isomerase|nr:FKBP-type peptidyl-prolyl cis-trans isomerase N-terminal domain-containing protein [Xanthomonadaceae bacterium]